MSQIGDDPWAEALRVLGVAEGADAGQLHSAYLARVREFPPDREPEAFEKVRDAYDLLRDPRRRAEHNLQEPPDPGSVTALLEDVPVDRPFVPLQFWLDALKEQPARAREQRA